MQKMARVLAYYLPQYLPIPENDRWWGKGFTEWKLVASAKPLYKGHYQPRLPADLGFYDLRVPETRAAQAEIARSYGVEAFCYYHYWFGGKRLLERPFEEVLKTGEPDFPFCLCWANHTWSAAWNGQPNKILIEQTYPGMDDYEKHFFTLLKAFIDERYVKVDGKPLFIVYRPKDIPDIHRVTDYWRELALQVGLPGLHLVGVNPWEKWMPLKDGFDASVIEKLPGQKTKHITWKHPLLKFKVLRKELPAVYSYEDVAKRFIVKTDPGYENYPCIIPNWDNTARYGAKGMVLQDSTPELFQSHVREAVQKIASQPEEHRIVILKAWNEWSEGNYVEPDLIFGYGYLEALKKEITRA